MRKPPCRRRRPERTSSPKRKGTNASGKYSLKEKTVEGSFYAKVGQTSTAGIGMAGSIAFHAKQA